MFTELVDMLEEVEGPLLANEWRAVFAEVMPDRPEAAAAAKDAYEWFSEKGARLYLEIFAPVWEQQLGEQAAAG
jgi:hypothetical protein